MQQITPLAERLKKQISQEQEIIEGLTRQQLAVLRKGLTSIVQRELSIINADIRRQIESGGWRLLSRRLLWPVLTGILLLLGICGGSWGLVQYYSNQILKMQSTVELLESRGGRVHLTKCGPTHELCAQVLVNGGKYTTKEGKVYMILEVD